MRASFDRTPLAVRLAFRQLGANWSSTLTIVATLALGVGANVVLFAVADAVMFRPFPFHDQERLVIGGESHSPTRSEVSYPNFRDWRDRSAGFDGLAAMTSTSWTFAMKADTPVTVRYRPVSANFFDVLGVRAARGRTFLAHDDERGAERILVLGHRLWQRQFGGATDVVGRTLTMSDTVYTVVGVMPADFAYPPDAEAWTPLVPALTAVRDPALPDLVEARGVGLLHVIGRPRPGVELTAARADIDRVIGELTVAHGRTGDTRARFTPLVEDLLGRSRPGLWALLAAVALLLVVATANVGGLMIAHVSRRRGQFAIQAALGASRGIIARQLLAETVLVTTAAAAAAWLIARATLPTVVRLVPPEIPRVDAVDLDGRVMLFTAAVAMLAALVCWITPALGLGRHLTLPFAHASRAITTPARAGSGRCALLALQLAVAVVVLFCAGLLYRSVVQLGGLDLGFDPSGLIALRVEAPPHLNGADRHVLFGFHDRVASEIRRLPFVESAGAVGVRPLKGPIGLDSPWQIEGQTADAARSNPFVNTEIITPAYFETMRTPVIAGRGFTADDREASERVVIVNRALAAWAWPGDSPIGKRIQVAALGGTGDAAPWHRVVGVAADIRYRTLDAPTLDVYAPRAQAAFGAGDLMVRVRGSASAALGTIAARAREVAPSSVVTIAAMEDELGRYQAPWRANLTLFGAFAAMTLLVAVVGVYAMFAQSVVEQRREIAVRLTLGATRSGVVWTVLRDAGRVALAGIAVGVGAAAAASRLIAALLFEVVPYDPATAATAVFLIAAAVLGACLVPALSAARIDPAVTLRAE